MHEQKVQRSYRIDLLIAFAVYAVMLVASTKVGRPMAEGWARTLVLVSPMVGFGLMIRALVRHARRIDEYMRMRLLEAIAVAAAIVCALSFTYGFLETAGYPKLSMFNVWVAMGISFALVLAVRAWQER
jgi:hypothetical protein